MIRHMAIPQKWELSLSRDGPGLPTHICTPRLELEQELLIGRGRFLERISYMLMAYSFKKCRREYVGWRGGAGSNKHSSSMLDPEENTGSKL